MPNSILRTESEIENRVIITILKFKSEVMLFDSYNFNNSV